MIRQTSFFMAALRVSWMTSFTVLRKFSRVVALLVGTALLVWAEGAISPLSTDKFCELTVSRLKLAELTWRTEKRPPTLEEEAPVFERFKTTSMNYLAFSGANAAEITDYLDSHPSIKSQIEALSASIRKSIENLTTP